jgi:hypothetical protein
MPDPCEHLNFRVAVTVNHLTNEGRDGTGPVIFVADLSIKCTDCNTKFVFLGVNRGLNFEAPTVNFLGDEAHLPIAPCIVIPARDPVGGRSG